MKDQMSEITMRMFVKVTSLQAQLEQSRRSVTELKRHCRHLTADLQDARVLTDSLQSRMHELDRKQRRFVLTSHCNAFCLIVL